MASDLFNNLNYVYQFVQIVPTTMRKVKISNHQINHESSDDPISPIILIPTNRSVSRLSSWKPRHRSVAIKPEFGSTSRDHQVIYVGLFGSKQQIQIHIRKIREQISISERKKLNIDLTGSIYTRWYASAVSKKNENRCLVCHLAIKPMDWGVTTFWDSPPACERSPVTSGKNQLLTQNPSGNHSQLGRCKQIPAPQNLDIGFENFPPGWCNNWLLPSKITTQIYVSILALGFSRQNALWVKTSREIGLCELLVISCNISSVAVAGAYLR